jgi:hypothetical protein
VESLIKRRGPAALSKTYGYKKVEEQDVQLGERTLHVTRQREDYSHPEFGGAPEPHAADWVSWQQGEVTFEIKTPSPQDMYYHDHKRHPLIVRASKDGERIGEQRLGEPTGDGLFADGRVMAQIVGPLLAELNRDRLQAQIEQIERAVQESHEHDAKIDSALGSLGLEDEVPSPGPSL